MSSQGHFDIGSDSAYLSHSSCLSWRVSEGTIGVDDADLSPSLNWCSVTTTRFVGLCHRRSPNCIEYWARDLSLCCNSPRRHRKRSRCSGTEDFEDEDVGRWRRREGNMNSQLIYHSNTQRQTVEIQRSGYQGRGSLWYEATLTFHENAALLTRCQYLSLLCWHQRKKVQSRIFMGRWREMKPKSCITSLCQKWSRIIAMIG